MSLCLFQVRVELERNLSQPHMNRFYELLTASNATIDYSPVASDDIAAFQTRGLRKGDAVIAAFCERHHITIFVSDNRDFLRHLLPPTNFEVLSPAEFCTMFNLVQ